MKHKQSRSPPLRFPKRDNVHNAYVTRHHVVMLNIFFLYKGMCESVGFGEIHVIGITRYQDVFFFYSFRVKESELKHVFLMENWDRIDSRSWQNNAPSVDE